MLLCLLACNSNKKTENTVQKTDNQKLIQLETTPCRGYCPVYKLTFFTNGEAQYEGIRFVKEVALRKFKLTADEQKRLNNKLAATDLWKYPESFPTTIADAPGATITVYKDQLEKTITGSIERPKPIREVQDLLNELAIAHGISLNSVNPNDIPEEAPKTEVLVKLKPEINAGNWLRDLNQTSKTGLQLVRRVSADNLWVVAFDGSKFALNDILDLLKAHEHVLEAQPNRKASERE